MEGFRFFTVLDEVRAYQLVEAAIQDALQAGRLPIAYSYGVVSEQECEAT